MATASQWTLLAILFDWFASDGHSKGLIESARSGDADSLAQLRHLAHRMHGTGATLGFTDIGEQAGIIERLTDGRPCDFDGLATSAARIEELLRAAAAKNGVSL